MLFSKLLLWLFQQPSVAAFFLCFSCSQLPSAFFFSAAASCLGFSALRLRLWRRLLLLLFFRLQPAFFAASSQLASASAFSFSTSAYAAFRCRPSSACFCFNSACFCGFFSIALPYISLTRSFSGLLQAFLFSRLFLHARSSSAAYIFILRYSSEQLRA